MKHVFEKQKWLRYLVCAVMLFFAVVEPICANARYAYIYDLEQDVFQHLGEASFGGGVYRRTGDSISSRIHLTGAYEVDEIDLAHPTQYSAVAKPVWGQVKLAIFSYEEEPRVIELSEEPYRFELAPGKHKICYVGKYFWGNVSVEAQTVESPIYIRDPNRDQFIPIPYQTAKSDTISGYSHILVDVTCLEEELNCALQTAYQEGSNILFVGEISVSKVEEVLGLPVMNEDVKELRDTLAAAESEYKNAELIDASAFHSVGKKVSSDRDQTVIADITVETETPDEIAEAINVALAYDYFSLTKEKNMENSLRSDWESVALLANTQYAEKCVTHSVTELRKYPLNPFGDDQYSFSVWRGCEVESRSGCYIRSIESEVSGKKISRMTDYQYDAAEKSRVIGQSERSSVKNTKLNGGIARPNIRVQFLPVSRIGFGAPTTSLRTFVEAELYQLDEVFAAGGFSYITVCDTMFGKNPTTYQTSIDILAGT